jgi:hypothetical protein
MDCIPKLALSNCWNYGYIYVIYVAVSVYLLSTLVCIALLINVLYRQTKGTKLYFTALLLTYSLFNLGHKIVIYAYGPTLLASVVYDVYDVLLFLVVISMLYIWTRSLLSTFDNKKWSMFKTLYVVMFSVVSTVLLTLDTVFVALGNYTPIIPGIVWSVSCFLLWIFYLISGKGILQVMEHTELLTNKKHDILYYRVKTIYYLYAVVLPLYMVMFLLSCIFTTAIFQIVLLSLNDVAGLITLAVMLPIVVKV